MRESRYEPSATNERRRPQALTRPAVERVCEKFPYPIIVRSQLVEPVEMDEARPLPHFDVLARPVLANSAEKKSHGASRPVAPIRRSRLSARHPNLQSHIRNPLFPLTVPPPARSPPPPRFSKTASPRADSICTYAPPSPPSDIPAPSSVAVSFTFGPPPESISRNSTHSGYPVDPSGIFTAGSAGNTLISARTRPWSSTSSKARTAQHRRHLARPLHLPPRELKREHGNVNNHERKNACLSFIRNPHVGWEQPSTGDPKSPEHRAVVICEATGRGDAPRKAQRLLRHSRRITNLSSKNTTAPPTPAKTLNPENHDRIVVLPRKRSRRSHLSQRGSCQLPSISMLGILFALRFCVRPLRPKKLVQKRLLERRPRVWYSEHAFILTFDFRN